MNHLTPKNPILPRKKFAVRKDSDGIHRQKCLPLTFCVEHNNSPVIKSVFDPIEIEQLLYCILEQ